MVPALTHDWTPNGKCPICFGTAFERELQQRRATDIKCNRCGYFVISRPLRSSVGSGKLFIENYMFSAICRILTERGVSLDFHSEADLQEAAAGVQIPADVNDKLDLALSIIANRQQRVNVDANIIADWDYPLVFCHDPDEFSEILEMLRSQGLVKHLEYLGDESVRLTAEGWQKTSSLQIALVDSDQAFVAMDFCEELTPAYDDGFFIGLKAAGWRPIRADRVEHAGSINDFIASQIRDSGLIVADFTYGNRGAYFEAGLAFGIPKQVIWTCRRDELPNLHFDIRQYSNILWDDPSDLATKLERRIRGMGLAR